MAKVQPRNDRIVCDEEGNPQLSTAQDEILRNFSLVAYPYENDAYLEELEKFKKPDKEDLKRVIHAILLSEVGGWDLILLKTRLKEMMGFLDNKDVDNYVKDNFAFFTFEALLRKATDVAVIDEDGKVHPVIDDSNRELYEDAVASTKNKDEKERRKDEQLARKLEDPNNIEGFHRGVNQVRAAILATMNSSTYRDRDNALHPISEMDGTGKKVVGILYSFVDTEYKNLYGRTIAENSKTICGRSTLMKGLKQGEGPNCLIDTIIMENTDRGMYIALKSTAREFTEEEIQRAKEDCIERNSHRQSKVQKWEYKDRKDREEQYKAQERQARNGKKEEVYRQLDEELKKHQTGSHTAAPPAPSSMPSYTAAAPSSMPSYTAAAPSSMPSYTAAAPSSSTRAPSPPRHRLNSTSSSGQLDAIARGDVVAPPPLTNQQRGGADERNVMRAPASEDDHEGGSDEDDNADYSDNDEEMMAAIEAKKKEKKQKQKKEDEEQSRHVNSFEAVDQEPPQLRRNPTPTPTPPPTHQHPPAPPSRPSLPSHPEDDVADLLGSLSTTRGAHPHDIKKRNRWEEEASTPQHMHQEQHQHSVPAPRGVFDPVPIPLEAYHAPAGQQQQGPPVQQQPQQQELMYGRDQMMQQQQQYGQEQQMQQGMQGQMQNCAQPVAAPFDGQQQQYHSMSPPPPNPSPVPIGDRPYYGQHHANYSPVLPGQQQYGNGNYTGQNGLSTTLSQSTLFGGGASNSVSYSHGPGQPYTNYPSPTPPPMQPMQPMQQPGAPYGTVQPVSYSPHHPQQQDQRYSPTGVQYSTQQPQQQHNQLYSQQYPVGYNGVAPLPQSGGFPPISQGYTGTQSPVVPVNVHAGGPPSGPDYQHPQYPQGPGYQQGSQGSGYGGVPQNYGPGGPPRPTPPVSSQYAALPSQAPPPSGYSGAHRPSQGPQGYGSTAPKQVRVHGYMDEYGNFVADPPAPSQHQQQGQDGGYCQPSGRPSTQPRYSHQDGNRYHDEQPYERYQEEGRRRNNDYMGRGGGGGGHHAAPLMRPSDLDEDRRRENRQPQDDRYNRQQSGQHHRPRPAHHHQQPQQSPHSSGEWEDVQPMQHRPSYSHHNQQAPPHTATRRGREYDDMEYGRDGPPRARMDYDQHHQQGQQDRHNRQQPGGHQSYPDRRDNTIVQSQRPSQSGFDGPIAASTPLNRSRGDPFDIFQSLKSAKQRIRWLTISILKCVRDKNRQKMNGDEFVMTEMSRLVDLVQRGCGYEMDAFYATEKYEKRDPRCNAFLEFFKDMARDGLVRLYTGKCRIGKRISLEDVVYVVDPFTSPPPDYLLKELRL